MKGMSKSKIGYTGIGADGRPVEWYYGWNPFGFGCSNLANCPGCWSHAMCRRSQCPDCRAFKVHTHPERMGQPAATKRPGVVLCNFTNDWLDPARDKREIDQACCAMDSAPRHVYVTLTKQAGRFAELSHTYRSIDYSLYGGEPANMKVFYGLTVRNQADADAKLRAFLTVKGNLWLSLEPLWGSVVLPDFALWADTREPGAVRYKAHRLAGVLVGHDSRWGAPGIDTLEHIRSVVQQCQAAGVPVYMKQLHLARCEHCGWLEHANTDCGFGEKCRLCGGRMKWTLEIEPARFPADLRLRSLPWSMPKEIPCHRK